MNVESTAITANNGPTVLVATDDGLVMGSDNNENGLFGVLRKDDPADERIVRTWALKTGRDGLIAFAQRGWRDPDTGIVYVTFRAEYADTPVTLAAGTASSGGLVYEEPTLPVVGGADRFAAVAKLGADELVMYGEIGGVARHFRGTLTRPGSSPLSTTIDSGNALGGRTDNTTGLALGRAKAKGLQSVAVGQTASADQTGSTAVGYGALVTSTDGVAVGKQAKASNAGTALGSGADGGVSGVAVGFNAKVTAGSSVVVGGGSATAASEAVAVGHGASAAASYAVAVGKSAVATESGTAVGRLADARLQSVAVGREAITSGASSVAIGHQSKAGLDSIAVGHQADATAGSNSIALGKGSVVTGSNQVQVGARYFELGELAADAPAPGANRGRLFVRDNGAGKTQLCARFPSGAVQVIATEP